MRVGVWPSTFGGGRGLQSQGPEAPTLDLAMIAMYKTYLQYILICCTCGESRDSSTEI